MTPPFRRVGVVGLGLMGGSLARALAALGVEVWGEDRDAATERAARAAGVVRGRVEEALGTLELLVLAVPVTAAPDELARLAPRLAPGALVTDLGSTKRSIAEAAERAGLGERFVGSHPLAGSHRSGWGSASAELYRGARVWICPTPRSAPEALERVLRLWSSLGADPAVLDTAAHDRELAWTSHLPQLASTAVARALAEQGLPRERLGPGGRDVTRLAASSPALWSAVCLDNAAAILPALDALVDQLQAARRAVRAGDADALHDFFARGRDWAG